METFSLKKLLFKNTGLQLGGQVICLLIGLGTTFILSRYLGVERFGGLSYVFAFYYFFFVIQDMGVDSVVIRECSKNPAQSAVIIGTMRTYKIAASLLFMSLALILIWSIPYAPAIRPALSIYALTLPLIALQHPSTSFQIHLNAKYPALIGILKSLTQLIFLVTLIAAGLGMTGYVLALVISESIVLAAVLFFSRNFVRPLWTFDRELCTSILKSGASLAVTGVFISIINRVDFLMLERMTDLKQVGYYAALYKITSLFETLPLMVMATLYPVMSRHASAGDWERLHTIHKKSFFGLTAIGLTLGVCVTFLAQPMIRLIFGEDYLPAAAGLRILIWATVSLYLALTSGNLLIAAGYEKINLAASLAAAVVNVTLNYLWIPALGFIGAAQATVCSFFLLFAVNLVSAVVLLRSKRSQGKNGPSK